MPVSSDRLPYMRYFCTKGMQRNGSSETRMAKTITSVQFAKLTSDAAPPHVEHAGPSSLALARTTSALVEPRHTLPARIQLT